MAVKDPTQTAQKWAQNLGAATTSIQNGVARVSTAPGQLAAAKVDTWLSKLQTSRDKWVRNTSAVTLSQWQTAMTQKGIPRIASGAQAAESKMTQFFQSFLPYVEQGATNVRNMPNVTLQDGINRAIAQIQWNAQYPGYR